MEFIISAAAKAAKQPYSDAVRVGDVLYLSGMVGNLPGSDRLVSGGMAAETRQALENIGVLLRQNGLSFDSVFKCTVLLADLSKWDDYEEVYRTFFDPERLPARTTFGTTGLALNALIEIECWARLGSS